MKRVGLIENMQDISAFVASTYEGASAAEVMAATGGNTGNVAFVHGIRKILGNPITRIDWSTPPDVVNSQVDHIVVCCANQLGEHVDLASWADRLEAFDKPITLIGLGAQAPDINRFPKLPSGTLRFLSVVDQRGVGKGANIAVRGEFTRSFLNELGFDSIPTGCPSLHISPVRDLGRRILERQRVSKVERVAVAAGNPWHGPSSLLERVLVNVVENFRGEYILQHPEAMFQYAYNETDVIDSRVRARFLEVYGPHFDQAGLLEWYRHYASVFVDAPNWMRFLRKFDCVLGPRYHGVALGVQACVPGCVVTIDSRTEELCKGTGIKMLSLEKALAMDAASLVRSAVWDESDAERLDSHRRGQAGLNAVMLEENGLEASAHARQLEGWVTGGA